MPYQWNYKFYYESFRNVMEISEGVLTVLVQCCTGKMATQCFRANRKMGLFLAGFHLLFIIYHLLLLMLLLVSIRLNHRWITWFCTLFSCLIFIISIYTYYFLFCYFYFSSFQYHQLLLWHPKLKFFHSKTVFKTLITCQQYCKL